MKTAIDDSLRALPGIDEAESILRNCVHCGFCTATCPTYQQLFDERDGPRGRIYLIKQLLEGGEVSEKTRTHLDRCLSCRSCETTCPSGVKYGRLLDFGRNILEKQVPRSLPQRSLRWGLRQVLPYRNRFRALLHIGWLVKPLLPAPLKQKLPVRQQPLPHPRNRQQRFMLTLEGCVQPAATPNTRIAAARVLDRLGISLISAPGATCCGAVDYHLSAQPAALTKVKRNIDSWWPDIERGAEAIVITASGCGAMVKEYGELLKSDPDYRDKAQRVSELAKDIAEILAAEDIESLTCNAQDHKIAIHCPCTLQHAQQLPGEVEQILERLGFNLAQTREKHLCCGSAGTYSILQPELSQTLLKQKLSALTQDDPAQIVTANIGCQMHLSSRSEIPVSHWIELVDIATDKADGKRL